MHDLDEAIQRVVGGPRTETHVLSDDELETIAIHEAAHAVVAAAHGDGHHMHSLSIVARGRRARSRDVAAGRPRPPVLRRSDLERQLAVTMAGAAAERLASARSRPRSTRTCTPRRSSPGRWSRRSACRQLGPVTIGENSAEVFLGASLQELGSVGPGTLERIDSETRAIVEDAEERAAATLRANWGVVEAVARELVEFETLDGAALLVHLAQSAPPRPATPTAGTPVRETLAGRSRGRHRRGRRRTRTRDQRPAAARAGAAAQRTT